VFISALGPIQILNQWVLSYFFQTANLQERVTVITVNFHENESEIIKSRWKIKENDGINVDSVV
jgi:ribosome-associated toxin RatA of RatAB toxin-antitoxin module